MKRIALLLATLLAMSGVPTSPAQAIDQPADFNAVGLMIKYRPGVEPLALNGRPTGENFAGVEFFGSHGIGNDFFAVGFESPMSVSAASRVSSNLKRDPRVEVVAIDHDYSIAPQGLKPSESKFAFSLPSVLKPASTPLSVKAIDAYSSSYPTTARIRLSWLPPKSLSGGRLAGFQVWKSVNGARFTVASTISNPKARYVYLALGLEAGRSTRLYVKAITKLGSTVKYGLASKPVSVTPTTRPAAPVISGYSDADLSKPKWTALTLKERGGLPVAYQVTATAQGKSTLTCTTTSTTCQLNNFSTEANYSITVKATNSRGSSISRAVIRPRDPYFYQQWYLHGDYGINAPAAWAQLPETYINPVVVAVVDSGIAAHSELNSQLVPGYDFVSADQTPNDGDGWDSDASDPGSFTTTPATSSTWHGTHVAGLIGAAANGDGTIGVAPGVQLQSVRALGGSGGKASDLVAAVTWASGGVVDGVEPNATPASVINISMGTAIPTSCDAGLQAAFTAAIARGVTIITSAGNGDASNNPILSLNSYPGNCLGSITVGATNGSGSGAYYSNYGLGVDISAPGGDDRVTAGTPEGSNGMLLSTFNSGATVPGAQSYAFSAGTSMAAPLVSGAVALFYAKSSTMNTQKAWDAIRAGAKKFRTGSQCALTVGTTSQRCGVGILDVAASLRLVK
jgi:serine protease